MSIQMMNIDWAAPKFVPIKYQSVDDALFCDCQADRYWPMLCSGRDYDCVCNFFCSQESVMYLEHTALISISEADSTFMAASSASSVELS